MGLRTPSVITLKAPRIPTYTALSDCHTLGDHLRRERLKRNHTQGFVAQKLNVTPDTVTNWERNRNEPTPPHIPNILKYLNYTPLFDYTGTSLSQRIRQTLYTTGKSQKELAKQIGVDEGSIKRGIREQRLMNKTNKRIKTGINCNNVGGSGDINT